MRCGPPYANSPGQLAAALRGASAAGRPVRGTGYHESVAGDLDRHVLDAWVSHVPVRIQHRSGAAWFLNSAALRAAGLDAVRQSAVERDADDQPTGRLCRGDHLLRTISTPLPDLARVGRLLSQYGVTGVTDATPGLSPRALAALREGHATGEVPQRLLLLGAALSDAGPDVGPWKVVLDEVAGLDLEGLIEAVRSCHATRRAIAFHAVTAAEAVVAVAALRVAPPWAGDRLEHGSVLPTDLDKDLRELGVTVVTQPAFVADRGDDYLTDVEPHDRQLLYRCRSLLDIGVRVAAGSDAPYSDLDPWQAMAAAVSRRTRHGVVLGDRERLDAATALRLYLGSPLDPGGPPRRISPGGAADLCLLDAPLDVVLADPAAGRVKATAVAGLIVHRRPDC